MRTRTPIRFLLTIALTLALLPMLSSFAPGGQVAGFTTASPAAANKVWYQSVGRTSATAPCEKSTATELAQGWTNWAPSWGQWANDRKGGFVCNRHITWAFDSVPDSRSCTTTSGGSIPTACALGTFGPGGGLVFYDAGSVQSWGRYMEAAPNTWSGGGEDPLMAWSGNTNTSVITGTAIGTGSANTTAIIAQNNTADRAATAARAYTGGGVSWFLPSKDELNAMCNYSRNPTTPAAPTVPCIGTTQDDAFAGGPFGFVNAFYWDSSQSAANDYAGRQRFDFGDQSRDRKSLTDRVRPVRAF
jgi:hypothetical protein